MHYIFCSTAARLALALRFLATGDNLRSIGYAFRVGHSTATESVNSITAAIFQVLAGDVLKKPSTEQWRTKAIEFYNHWNFPNCVGAADGKHISIQCPAHSGWL
jgi:hypothetical protein